MRLQDSPANCGPSAIGNALKALGMSRSSSELEALCKTTAAQGTSYKNLVKALNTIEELHPHVIEESRGFVAHLALDAALRNGRPVVLCADNWEHWVAAVGLLGPRVLVADSADSELVTSSLYPELMERWACEGAKKPYWGVVL